ncbi:MAG: BCCT family transporter, partial [Planctomycetota bacterium]
MSARHQIDWISFSASLGVILLVCLPLAFFADSGGQRLLDLYELIASRLGFLYIAAGAATLLFLLCLAGSRYGNVILGPVNVEPEFSTVSWAGMLFCAGVGAGLMFWAPVEWAYYYDAPPFGISPRSNAAAEWAATYGLFHWGPTAWAFYCLPTLAIAYPYYNRHVEQLRFSTSFHGLWGPAATTAPVGRIIDILFMVALLGGAGSSIGFSTPMIAACLGELFGITPGFGLELGAVLLCVVLFATSVWFGLRRG